MEDVTGLPIGVGVHAFGASNAANLEVVNMIAGNRSSVGTAITITASILTFGALSGWATPVQDSGKKGPVRACYKKKSGTLRMAIRGKRCRRGERMITWNMQGPRGARGIADEGPRGQTGAKGVDGQTGAKGADGQTGAKGADGSIGPVGPAGPSESREAVNLAPVTLTGMDVASANSLATLPSLPAGDYLVIARVQLNSASTLAARVSCLASLGGKGAKAIADIGNSANSVDHVPIAITFNVSLGNVASANVKCWEDVLTGGAPTASDTYLEALRVGSATSTSVTG